MAIKKAFQNNFRFNLNEFKICFYIKVLLISLLLGASSGAASVQEPVHHVQPAEQNQEAYPTFQQDDDFVSDLGQDDSGNCLAFLFKNYT